MTRLPDDLLRAVADAEAALNDRAQLESLRTKLAADRREAEAACAQARAALDAAEAETLLSDAAGRHWQFNLDWRPGGKRARLSG